MDVEGKESGMHSNDVRADVGGPHFRTAKAEDIENAGIVNTRVSTKREIAIVLHSA